MEASVSIVIPNYNGAGLLRMCLDSITNSTFKNFELIIVDNSSTDNSFQVFNSYTFNKKWIQLDKNYGFAYAVNQGILESSSKYVFLLNNDTTLREDTISILYNYYELNEEENLAGIQPLMLQQNNKILIDDAGDSLSWYCLATKNYHSNLLSNYPLVTKEVFSLSGGASFFCREKLKDIGGYDQKFESYLEDIDLGLRARLYGYSFKIVPDSILYHVGGGSNILRTRYVKNMTRNRLLIILKNIPLSLIIQKSFYIIYGQMYCFLAYAKPKASFAGYIAIIKELQASIDDRRIIKQKIKLSKREIKLLLTTNTPTHNIGRVFIDFIYNLIYLPLVQIFK